MRNDGRPELELDVARTAARVDCADRQHLIAEVAHVFRRDPPLRELLLEVGEPPFEAGMTTVGLADDGRERRLQLGGRVEALEQTAPLAVVPVLDQSTRDLDVLLRHAQSQYLALTSGAGGARARAIGRASS